MRNEESHVRINIGGLFTTLLAIVFITLKLCHVIDWSWWWVLAPLWIPLALVVFIALIIAIVSSKD